MAQRRGISPTFDEPPGEAASRSGRMRDESGTSGADPATESSRVPRWTSGRECWVFRAETPDQLCGHHPQLISSALAPSEPLHYLLYSPIFDAKDGPFRVGGAPGSHAVGITPRRLLISRDSHAGSSPRSVTRIDLEAISSVELGCALAMGWLVVRFSGPQGAGACRVVFGAQGMGHFRAVVRAYRAPSADDRFVSGAALGWPEIWEGVPSYLRNELEPLIEEGERPLAILRSPERWTAEKRLWRTTPVCISAGGLLVVTSLGLLWAACEPATKPDGIAFGVNVTVVRSERVLDVGLGAQGTLGILRVQAGDRSCPHELEVPFDGGDRDSAAEIVHLTRAWRSRT
jgi:hypothetical protein